MKFGLGTCKVGRGGLEGRARCQPGAKGRLWHLAVLALSVGWCCSVGSSARAEVAKVPAWVEPPQLMVMSGFWKNQTSPQSYEDWLAHVGSDFDASEWARTFKDAGAGCFYFFDKWEGMIWHNTATTDFKTKRDFVREVADACHAQGLPVGYVTEPLWGQDPQFAEYAVRDADGVPYAPLPGWEQTWFTSLHSPYREKTLEQVRELVRDYGPTAMIWLDTFSNPWPQWRWPWTDEYSAKAFQKRYGIPIQEASPKLADEFVLATVGDFAKDICHAARELNPDVCFTMNQSVISHMNIPRIAANVHEPLTYFSVEGHTVQALERDSTTTSFLQRPIEIGFWTWGLYCPPEPGSLSRNREAVAAAALAWSQGANVWFGILPDLSGKFGPELGGIQDAGRWLQPRREVLKGTLPWRDVGVILGAPAPTLGVFPALSELWYPSAEAPGLWEKEERPYSPHRAYFVEPVPPTSFRDRGAWGTILDMHMKLRNMGYGSDVLYALTDMAAWPKDLSPFRALVVPERACMDQEHVARLRQYVRSGGQLIAFGHGLLLGPEGDVEKNFALANVLGLRFEKKAKFPGEENLITCSADSQKYREFDWDAWGSAANIIDGTPAAWNSMEWRMPHWAQVNLPAGPSIARVRITPRSGCILSTFEVLLWTGDKWERAQYGLRNLWRTVDFTLDPPRKARAVRVVISRELFPDASQMVPRQAQERPDAGIAELELFGPDGTLLTHQEPFTLKTTIMDEELKGEVGESPLVAPALVAEPRGAEVLATYTDPTGGEARPLLTRHRFGAGTAYWMAVGEASIAAGSPWWPALTRLVAGSPSVTWNTPRHRVILRKKGDALLICASDSQIASPPEPLRLRLHLDRLGLRGEVDPWADGKAARVQKIGGDLELEITPDPAVTMLVR